MLILGFRPAVVLFTWAAYCRQLNSCLSNLTRASQQHAAAIVQILGEAARAEGRKQGLASGLWAGQLS